jgi:Ca-activated chloride channel family protein
MQNTRRRRKMLRFENPAAFILLGALPLLYALRAAGILSRPRFPLTMNDWGAQGFVWKTHLYTFLHIFSAVLGIGAFCLLTAAFASPVYSRQERVYITKGAEILFVIDVSPSMAAKDMGGMESGFSGAQSASRLDIARSLIEAFVRENTGTAFGLAATASEAVLLVPGTQDRDVFSARLRSLKIGELGEGTALGTGLATAVYHLSASESPKKAIVLLTDGENNAGEVSPLTSAALAAEFGISVYVVGIGSRGQVPIEYTDPVSGRVYSGTLESWFNEDSLKELAAAGTGEYFHAENVRGLSSALALISSRETVNRGFSFVPRHESAETPFIIGAMILIAAAWCIRRLVMGDIL